MTTSDHSLDDHKVNYELTPGDPKRPKPSALQISKLHPAKKMLVRRKRFNPIKEYFKAMIEVILK